MQEYGATSRNPFCHRFEILLNIEVEVCGELSWPKGLFRRSHLEPHLSSANQTDPILSNRVLQLVHDVIKTLLKGDNLQSTVVHPGGFTGCQCDMRLTKSAAVNQLNLPEIWHQNTETLVLTLIRLTSQP